MFSTKMRKKFQTKSCDTSSLTKEIAQKTNLVNLVTLPLLARRKKEIGEKGQHREKPGLLPLFGLVGLTAVCHVGGQISKSTADPLECYHRRRIKTEEKAKVVTSGWGEEFI